MISWTPESEVKSKAVFAELGYTPVTTGITFFRVLLSLSVEPSTDTVSKQPSGSCHPSDTDHPTLYTVFFGPGAHGNRLCHVCLVFLDSGNSLEKDEKNGWVDRLGR